MKHIVYALFCVLLASQASAQSTDWVITKTQWTAQDEQNYSNFVQALGRAACYTVADCIHSSANPYRDSDPATVKFWSDCADWPYFLRAYFAWKNELPFGYVSGMATYDAIERRKHPPVLAPGEKLKPIDDRYSEMGNYPASRFSITTGKRTLNFVQEMNRMQDTISSAMMRVAPEYDGSVLNDFYSPEIRLGLGAIHPGTLIYDPNGHVAVIYDVLPDGSLRYFDAHPDNSITHGLFNAKFMRSRPAQGAGFKNFRPLSLVGATKKGGFWGGTKEYVGGTVVLSHNQDIPDYGTTQYYGTQPDSDSWSKGPFFVRGKQVDFYEYVRATLATVKINPVQEFASGLQELCDDFKERRDSVEVATAKGFHLKPHPATLPSDIFGAAGDWENYSTPGRDVRLRVSFVELQKSVTERYRQYLNGDFSDMQYDGTNLKRDLLQAFHQANFACPVSYTNSSGQVINLSLELGIRRLYAMSFDPYNCPERRWGATNLQELKTCRDDDTKTAWYNGEQRIRNFLQRDWAADNDITLSLVPSLGSDSGPSLDVRTWLTALPEKGN